MKIDIKYPFTKNFNRAYKVSSQGRNTIILYNTKTKNRKTISYARYLKSCELKRELLNTEEVDHIDDIKNNDVISNLQILTKKENIRKTHSIPDILCVCPVCNIKFYSTKRKLHKKTNLTKCCSRKCGGIYSHKK